MHDRTWFAVYKWMQVSLPTAQQVSHTPKKDTIRATPAVPARALQKEVPAHFDTVIAREFPGDPFDSNKNKTPLEDLRVAHIRAIFRLPEEYGTQFKHPLAYVEWFTPFHSPVPDIGMYKIAYSR
ncbi:hypothetical protein SCP_1403030 [Sparassis crispa]|uniref:Uncharacterized protein n=1 Tax=Sparassis crispa TaxID=139825 RepID=A0A401H377_9APHY|nr:hypothetical protein SCP_1403030 [Sparassis crispa]GBE88895.1 hypothetical protein SCP_1403030 [Sparassis crispa]